MNGTVNKVVLIGHLGDEVKMHYFDGGNWIRSRHLPRYYNNYDISRGYKVVIDYHGRDPYHDFYSHKKRYKCKQYYSCCDRNYKHKYYKKKHKRHHDDDDDD